MAFIKSEVIHGENRAGPGDKPFERRTVLGMCSRTIFDAACTGDVDMAQRSVSSLVGKQQALFNTWVSRMLQWRIQFL